MAKYKVVKEFSFIPQVTGDNFIMNTPPPIILKVGDVIEGTEFTVPVSNVKVLVYTYTTPPQAVKSFYVPMANVVKDDSTNGTSTKITLKEKYNKLSNTQKVVYGTIAVVVPFGIIITAVALVIKFHKHN